MTPRATAVRGLPCLWLAACVFLAQLLAPLLLVGTAMATPQAWPICHASGSDQPPASPATCLLCPACQLASPAAVLPDPPSLGPRSARLAPTATPTTFVAEAAACRCVSPPSTGPPAASV